VSAGGIVYRKNHGRIEIVVCGRFDSESYHLPKGTPELGETREETALREVQEETGLETEILGFVGEINYLVRNPICEKSFRKTVFFYLMKPTGGDFSLHDKEFDFVKWIKVSEIVNTLTYINEVDIVQKSLSLVKSGF
jgi:8-oxo-dGTP diphosphatase